MGEDFSQSSDLKPETSGKATDSPWAGRTREWRSPLAILVAGFLGFLTRSGLSIWLLPFNRPNQLMVFIHTVAGAAVLIPSVWYLVRHWPRYWRNNVSHVLVLGCPADGPKAFRILTPRGESSMLEALKAGSSLAIGALFSAAAIP